MDKENNNVDDVLKLLKNKLENTDDAPELDDVEGSRNNTDDMSTEDLHKKLREQFMSDDDASSVRTGSEYSIDEEIISEFYEEAQRADENDGEPELEEVEVPERDEADIDAEPEVEVKELEVSQDEPEELFEAEAEETVADNAEGEIVEIVIPWVDSIAESAEALDDEEEAEEENDDFYTEESSENPYICFADEEVNDDEIFEQDEEIEEEESDDLAAMQLDDGDLPWYSDDDLPVSVDNSAEEPQPTIILPIDEDEDDGDDYADAFEAALDEEERELEEESGIQIDITDILESDAAQEESEIIDQEESYLESDASEEAPENTEIISDDKQEEPPAYKLFSNDKNTHAEPLSENEEESFYQTIIKARAERESLYGYFKSDAEDNSDIVEDAVDLEGTVLDAPISDEVELPEFKYDEKAYVLHSESAGFSAEQTSDSDFYGSGEHDADPDEDKQFGEEHAAPILEFEHETEGEFDSYEAEVSAIWKITKPIIMGILALAILVLEMLPLLGIVPDGLFDYTSYTVPYILIDAQLLIFMAALCYEKLVDGLLKIITPLANFYSILSLTLIVTLLCSIISCFCASDDMPRLYNFISAVYLLGVHIFEMLDKKRRKDSERMLAEDSVYTLHRSQGKNSCAEKMYLGGVDPDTTVLEPVEVEANDFRPAFSREKIGKNRNFSNNVLIGAVTPVAIFAIFMAVLTIVFEQGLYTSVNAFAFAFVSAAPLGAMIAYYLPILISHFRLSGRGCVIAGYESAAEISECDALVFGDCHLFKECDAKEAGIKLYCDQNKTRELFVCLASVYAKIGGPMENTFASVLGGAQHKVNMIRITRNGFEAVVDNRYNLIVGGSEYLGRYGIVTDRADLEEAGIIYAAMNSTLCAKISVLYRTHSLFEILSEILESYGVRAVIETYDPMISGKYVARCRDARAHSVSVVHKNVNDYNLPEKDKAPLGRSGVFATASRLKLVELIGFCKSITQIRKLNTGILIGSYAVSAVVCILLVLGGAMEHMNLLWALLYQLALIGIYTAISLKFLPLSFDGMQERKAREEIKRQERENRDQI